MSKTLILSLALLATTSLGACSWFDNDDDKTPLPGKRFSILQIQSGMEPANTEMKGEGFIAPPVWQNEFWPQAGGYPNHATQNPALSGEKLKRIWKEDIGNGATDEYPLTSAPVVYEGKIFTLDTDSQVSAFDVKNGDRKWRRSIRPKQEDEEVIGGGIAADGNTLYITNGYREVVALDIKDGKTIWRSLLPSPSRAAPTIVDNSLYVITLDNRLLALETSTGRKKWEYEGLAETTELIGAASAAANHDIVVAPMSSGELTALRIENGSVAWSENLASLVQRGGSTSLPDISGLPVIDKDLVIGISFGGKIMAIEQRTGHPVWQRDIGSAKSPWVAGNTIFLISSNSELVALGRNTGVLEWARPLDAYIDPKEHNEQTRSALLWNGPVFAGGTLYITAPNGKIIRVNPETGQKSGEFDNGSRVALSPAIADGTMFLISQDGTLSAWK